MQANGHTYPQTNIWSRFRDKLSLPSVARTITDRVVYSIDYLFNEWAGDDFKENDEDVNVRFEKFFSVEDLDF